MKSGFWQTRDKMDKLDGWLCEKKINDFCIFDMAEGRVHLIVHREGLELSD